MTLLSALGVFNYGLVLIYGLILSVAIAGGCRIYDFRGESGDLSPDNPLYGLYRFKKGFNGDFCEFCGQFTMIYKPLVSKGMDLAMKCHKKLRHMMAMKKSKG